jgi:hypothetical protein
MRSTMYISSSARDTSDNYIVEADEPDSESEIKESVFSINDGSEYSRLLSMRLFCILVSANGSDGAYF